MTYALIIYESESYNKRHEQYDIETYSTKEEAITQMILYSIKIEKSSKIESMINTYENFFYWKDIDDGSFLAMWVIKNVYDNTNKFSFKNGRNIIESDFSHWINYWC